MKQCSKNYQVQLVPLAFDIVSDGVGLVGDTIVNIDDHIVRALKNKDFQKTVAKAVREYSEKGVKDIKNGKPLDTAEGDAVIDAALEGFRGAVESSIKQEPKYHQLKQEANAFKNAFECSSTGVWVDNNKTTLVVVGAVGIVGGVAYMYKNRTGGKIAELSQGLLAKAWKVGTVNLNTKVTKFQPSSRELGIALESSGKWHTVNSKFNINFLAKDKNYDLSTEGSLTIALSTTKTIALGMIQQSEGSFGPPADDKQQLNTDISAFATLKYKNNATEMDVAAKYSSEDKYSFLASFRINF